MTGPIKKMKEKIATKKAQKYSDSKRAGTKAANDATARELMGMKKGGSVKKMKKGGTVKKK